MATLRKATQKTGERELNDINKLMRESDWYQDWLLNSGEDPMKVTLDEQQRGQLTGLAQQNGFELGDRMKVDEAGNFNQKGGWAGMSPAMKALIIAAAGVGTAGIASAAMGGGAGIGASGLGSGMSAATSGAGAHAAGGGLMMGSGLAGAPALVGGGTAAASTALPLATKAAGGSSALSKAGKLFNGKGLDATTLLLGGMSMLGGDGTEDNLTSFAGTSADPTRRMTEALDAIKNMTSQVQSRGPSQLRSNLGPSPISVDVPGVPFQIGGGLGMDPAIRPEPGAPTSFPDLFGGQGGVTPAGYGQDMNKKKAQPK
jgi:hypothetical protein